MIEINQLSHQYSNAIKPALTNINFTIQNSSILGLLGPNGAGKTTLMSLLSGLQKIQKGDIYIDGTSFKKLSNKELHKISLVPQDFAFYPLLTVWENLIFFSSIYNIKDKKQIINILNKVNLEEHKNKLAKNLSGGLKRRLNFAIGLINNPKIIFLDEITVGIDPESRQFILKTVLELKNNGVTVIYTSHYLQEIELLCDKLVIINEGNLVYKGNKDDILKENKTIESFYLDLLDKV